MRGTVSHYEDPLVSPSPPRTASQVGKMLPPKRSTAARMATAHCPQTGDPFDLCYLCCLYFHDPGR